MNIQTLSQRLMQMHSIERYVLLIERGQSLVCVCLTDSKKTFTL